MSQNAVLGTAAYYAGDNWRIDNSIELMPVDFASIA